MLKLLIIIFLLLLGLISLKAKMNLNMTRKTNIKDSVPSPLSEAIAQLIGVAGGIYLSLIMFCTFLSINIPDQITIFSIAIDPLALFAILLSFVQPIFIYLLRNKLN